MLFPYSLMIRQNTIITIAAIKDKNNMVCFPIGHADFGMLFTMHVACQF
jgi:hypothetical protein